MRGKPVHISKYCKAQWLDYVKNVEIASNKNITVTEAARDSFNYYSIPRNSGNYDSSFSTLTRKGNTNHKNISEDLNAIVRGLAKYSNLIRKKRIETSKQTFPRPIPQESFKSASPVYDSL